MASIASSSHLPALSEPHERDAVGKDLQATLHDLLSLALTGKQLHWCVVGEHFRSLHLQIDELVADWLDLADTVAERAVAIGFIPDGQAPAVVAGSKLTPVAQSPIADRVVVRELTDRIAKAGELARERMDWLASLDAASQDVLIAVVRKLEEQLWMMRAQLAGRSASSAADKPAQGSSTDPSSSDNGAW